MLRTCASEIDCTPGPGIRNALASADWSAKLGAPAERRHLVNGLATQTQDANHRRSRARHPHFSMPVIKLFFLAVLFWSPARLGYAAPLLTEVGQEIALGDNLNQEACRLRRTEAPKDKPGRIDYGLFCEGWTQPSGFLVTFPAGPGFNPAEILSKGNYAEQLVLRLAECSVPAPAKIADRLAGAVRFCRRRDGGWPMVVGSTSTGGRGYVFETLPTNVPLAERAVDALSTNKGIVVTPPPRTALILQFEGTVNISATQFGVGDLGAVHTLSVLGEEEVWATRFVESERAWSKVLEIMERVFGPDSPDNGRALTNIALAIYRQGRLAEADEMLKRAEPLVKRSRRPDDYPEWMTFRSYVEHSLNHNDLSLSLAQQALERRRALRQMANGFNGNYAAGYRSAYAAAVGHSALVLARAYDGLGRFREAIAPSEEGIREYTEAYGDIHPMIGWTYLEEAMAYRETGDLPHARIAAEKALAMHQYLYGDRGPVFLDAVMAGRIAVAEQRNQDALKYFEQAIRSAQSSSEIPLLPADWLAQYMDLLNAGGGGPAEAFAAAQLVRGGVTDEAIRAMAARAAADEPAIASVARALQDAQARAVSLRGQIANEMRLKPIEHKPQDEKADQDALAEAEADAAAAEQRLQAQFPQYARLVKPSRVSAEEINQLLHPDEALLLAVTMPSSTYLFLLRGGQTYVNKAAISSSELGAKITAIRDTLDLAESGGSVQPFDVRDAEGLYATLLAPIAEQMANLHHLVFVSNGPLLSLPLGVLMRPQKEAERAPAYLAQDFAISVVPTVGAFRDLRQAPSADEAPEPFLGFGNPQFAGSVGETRGLSQLTQKCRSDKSVDVAEIRDLARLPETEGELRTIATALQAPADSVVLGADATKQELLSRDLERYRVIAFSTHGLLANQLDCQNEPALLFSLPQNATRGEDALLTASQIVSLHLKANWILLSACNTAGPNGLAGEALSGLTRAFFYAGARSVMATHWPVESEATVRLTTLTFENYTRNPTEGKASALREAELALLNKPETSHPIFWAPFVLVGDGGERQ
jgi:CHAT domain-containing protein